MLSARIFHSARISTGREAVRDCHGSPRPLPPNSGAIGRVGPSPHARPGAYRAPARRAAQDESAHLEPGRERSYSYRDLDSSLTRDARPAFERGFLLRGARPGALPREYLPAASGTGGHLPVLAAQGANARRTGHASGYGT